MSSGSNVSKDVNMNDIKTISQQDTIIKRLDMYLGSSESKTEQIYAPKVSSKGIAQVFT